MPLPQAQERKIVKAANGSIEECLFIGGPWDGRRGQVESECKIFHVTYDEDDADAADETPASALRKNVAYRRGVLRAPGREWSVFFAPDVDDGDVIGRLIEGYRPVPGKAKG